MQIGYDGGAGRGAGLPRRRSEGNAGANPALYQEPYTLMNGLAVWLVQARRQAPPQACGPFR